MHATYQSFVNRQHRELAIVCMHISRAWLPIPIMEIPGRFLMLPLFLLLPSALPVSDHAAFVYKTCAPKTLITGAPPSSLLAQLAHQSWHSSFFNTAQTAGMSGLFQCRQDMSSHECGSCVNSAAHMLETACGPSTAARVQLEGCYAQYETRQVSGGWETGQVLYKECGDAYGNKAALEKTLMSMDIMRSGYYRGNYDSVEMTAQCDADLDECECRECLSDALLQCPASLSARIFLPNCSIAYLLFHPTNNSSKRIAAIVVGGCVALLLGLLFLSFFRSRYSKRHYYY